ncbi:hypothetical protein [Bacillus sp. OAE603]|uniref:hypothetical protein n=1 Tax=Gottfriedia sp. OAE603 TaxID=2663872 RepID=UPI001788EB1A
MHPFWNHYPHYPSRNDYTHMDNHHMMQSIANLENQIQNLVKAIEANNELLRSIEQKQNQVITSGGGSVIVRM